MIASNTPSSAPTVLPWSPRRADAQPGIALALALAVVAFHLLNGLPLVNSVLLHDGYNWLFDFDSSRYLTGWCTAGLDTFEDLGGKFGVRHPIGSLFRPPCLALAATVGSPGLALMILTAACAGAGTAVAYLLAAQFCDAEADRVLLSLAYSVSAQPLVLGIAPETYGFAMAGIGWHLLLLARGHGRPLGATWPAVLSVVLNTGITITNGVLNLLSSAVMSWGRMDGRGWLRTEVRTWLWAGLAMLALALALSFAFMPDFVAQAFKAPKLLLWSAAINRGEAASLVTVVQTFLFFNLVAPAASFIDLGPPESHAMLDYRGFNYGIAGLVAVALWGAALAASLVLTWREVALRRYLWVLLGWIGANILLHWYWQYRGSIFMYGGHSMFAVFALVAVGYGLALRRLPAAVLRAGAVATIACTAYNNFGAYRHVIDFVLRHGTTT